MAQYLLIQHQENLIMVKWSFIIKDSYHLNHYFLKKNLELILVLRVNLYEFYIFLNNNYAYFIQLLNYLFFFIHR